MKTTASRRKRGLFVLVCCFVMVISLDGLARLCFAQQVTLRYWDLVDPKLDNPRSRGLAQNINRFEAANPNIKITVEVIPWQNITQQLIQAAAANRTPDVIRIFDADLQKIFKAGAVLPLNEFTDKWPAAVRNDFIIAWDQTLWNGKKMTIPYEHRVYSLWYRKDLLSAAGQKVPESVDELINVARVLNKGNIQGFVVPLSRGAQAAGFGEWLHPMLWAGGGELFDANENPVFNGPAGVRAVQIIMDLVNKGAMPQGVVAYSSEEQFEAIKAGTVAMTGFSSHRFYTAREAGKFGDNLQSTYLPGYTKGKPAPTLVSGWHMSIGKDTKNKEAAWKFIEHLTSTETQIITAKVVGEMPTRKTPFNDPWFQSKNAADMMFWKEYAEKYGRRGRYPERYVELMQLIADSFQEVVLRNTDPQKALNSALQRYKELVR